MRLTRNLFIPCIDTSANKDLSGFVPVDLSTIFELSWNPQEETYAYICYKNDSTETIGYQPELPQEIVLDSDNPMYVFMREFAWKFPVGSSASRPVLIVEPDAQGAATVGHLWREAVISVQALNTVDGKLTFTLKLNGDPVLGTVAISETGGQKTITFTEATNEG